MERRQSTLNSQCHSVFNGWQLIAQQDRYQQLKHTIDGNIVEWIFETSYAVCQPNGQVLALLNPKGRTLWRKENKTLWGLCFPNEYKQPSPLDPQLLFTGQYFDEESGVAYNRFRYYDPESGNYISSDPIGLNGGEKPFGYVSNPLDWVDLFGVAGCWASARKKYWKNEALTNPHRYSPNNLARMAQGKAPKMKVEVFNPKTMRNEIKDVSMELHHKYLHQRTKTSKAHSSWNLEPVTPWSHEAMDTFRHTGTELRKILKGVNSW